MSFRLANVRTIGDHGPGRAALVEGDRWFDLAAVTGDETLADPMAAVARHREAAPAAAMLVDRRPDGRLDDVDLLAPVPVPPKVFGIGLNYRSHAEETGRPLPEAPLTFTKFPTAISGPDTTIELSGPMVDWEVELVVVIGTGGRTIAEDRAWSHVAGLTLGQDISDRALQFAGEPPQFNLAKSFDGYGPIGPVICSPDLFEDRNDIGLTCHVNDEEMQRGRTSDLIFDVATLIAYLSSICTLTPGDLIFTGTPDGVGVARGLFLRPGDVITSTAETIGSFTTRCATATDSTSGPPAT